MIIIGYPGIGKSTLAIVKYNVIDLESSLFRHLSDNWYVFYVALAIELSNQGNVVFVSTHNDVIEELIRNNEKAGMIYPSLDLKDEWISKTGERLLAQPTLNNLRTYERVNECFDKDINYLRNIDLPKMEINDMDYNLSDIVNDLKKRRFYL